MKKEHANRGRKRSPEAIAKSIETRRKNREAKLNGTVTLPPLEERVRDAVTYLTSVLTVRDRDYKDCLIRLAIHALKGTI